MFVSSLSLILALLVGAPRVAQIAPDVRSGAGMWLAGDGFNGASFKYDNSVTVTKDNLQAKLASALAGPPSIDWNTAGSSAPITVYNDNVANASPNIEQIGAYAIPFAVRNPDGFSRTYVANKPILYGIAGEAPDKLYYGVEYPIPGRHLTATHADATLWLVSDQFKEKKYIPLPTMELGGRGTGDTRDLNRSICWFTIPDGVDPGVYSLCLFHGENEHGLSNRLTVNVPGAKDPWQTAKVVDVIAKNGQDVTTAFLAVITAKSTELDPLVLRLPPGVFYLSKTIELPSNVGIIGSGIKATRLVSSAGGDYSDPSQRIPAGPKGRSGMIKIVGSNVLLADMTIELTPNTVQSVIVGGTGIDRVKCRRVRFENLSAFENQYGYSLGTIYRYGLWRFWRFDDCEWRCQLPFEANLGPFNGWANNGAADYCLIRGGSFESIYGRASASLFGSIVGRGCVVQGLEISHSRRGFSFTAPDGCMESVIALCSFDNMLSEIGNGESILHEARGSFLGRLASASSKSISIAGDTVDRTRWTVCVTDGPGRFQYRVIESSANGVHQLETPWEIVPDSDSIVLISQCPTDCSYVWNRFTNTVGGINLYGNSLGCSVNSNWFRESHEGVMLATNWDIASTRGFGGQNGDGRSLSWWHSMRGNVFQDGTGFNFRAPRQTTDLLVSTNTPFWTNPQIAFVSTSGTRTYGTVTNQLWASEGTDSENAPASNTNTVNLQKRPLIDYISSTYDVGYSGTSKYHAPVIDRRPEQPLWYRTPAGVGNVRLGGIKWDDVPSKSPIVVAPSAN